MEVERQTQEAAALASSRSFPADCAWAVLFPNTGHHEFIKIASGLGSWLAQRSSSPSPRKGCCSSEVPASASSRASSLPARCSTNSSWYLSERNAYCCRIVSVCYTGQMKGRVSHRAPQCHEKREGGNDLRGGAPRPSASTDFTENASDSLQAPESSSG